MSAKGGGKVSQGWGAQSSAINLIATEDHLSVASLSVSAQNETRVKSEIMVYADFCGIVRQVLVNFQPPHNFL